MKDREKLRELIIVMYHDHLLTQREIASVLQLSPTVVSDLIHQRWHALKETRAKHFIQRAEDAMEYGYIL